MNNERSTTMTGTMLSPQATNPAEPSRMLDPSVWHPGAPQIADPPVGAVGRPVMVQHWSDLVFCHWRYPVNEVQALLPDGVTVDAFDGSAWVGLIPFHMDGLGVPGWAPMPYVGSFPEVNVRTYVRAGDRRGVWFMSLDIDRWLPALVARGGYRIPYCVGDVRHLRIGDRVMSSVRRRWPRSEVAAADLSVTVGDPIADDDLSRFLTARWGLVARPFAGRPVWAPVDHPAWPLMSAEMITVDPGVVVAAGLSAPRGDAHLMYSPGVPVRIGRPQLLRRR